MERSNYSITPQGCGRRPLLVHHVARRTGLSRRMIRYLAQHGKIPAFKLGPKIWGFDPKVVEVYAEERYAL